MKKELSMPYAIVISALIISVTFFITAALFFNEKNKSPKMIVPPQQMQNKERPKMPEKPNQPVSATSSVR